MRRACLLLMLAWVGVAHGQTAATPTFSPAAGTYLQTQTPAISTTTSGATICYRTDGTAPAATTPGTCDAGSTTLTNGSTITISSVETVKALATLSGDTNSAVASAAYAFMVAIPQFSPPSNTYSSSQTVTISTITPGASLYYAVNAQPTCGGTAYTTPVTVSVTEILYAIGCLSGYTSAPARAPYNIGTFTAGVPSADGNAYCGVGDVPLFPNDGPAIAPQQCNYTKRSASPSPNGVQWTPSTAAAFTTALAGAACGDIIQIPFASVVQGNFTVPANSCTASTWITIETSGLANFPPEGTRATPCYFGVSSLPGRPNFSCTSTTNYGALIEGSGVNGRPITFANGVHYVRLIGLQFAPDPANVFGTEASYNDGLVWIEGGNDDHIIFDQVWVHGNANNETSPLVALGANSTSSNEPTTNISWIDGFYSDAHCVSSIGQCDQANAILLGGINSSVDGTFKIVNNYIESGGSCLGAGGGAASTVPSDVEIRLNNCFKPQIWNPSSSTYNGGLCNSVPVCGPFVVTNVIEFKSLERVFIEGNRLQNSWEGFSQTAPGVQFDVKNANGTSPNSTIRNIIVRYNYGSTVDQPYIIVNTYSGTGGIWAYAGNSFSVHDDAWDDIADPLTCGNYTSTQCANNPVTLFDGPYAYPTVTQSSLYMSGVLLNHETWVLYGGTLGETPTNLLLVTGPASAVQANLTITNNILPPSTGLGATGGGLGATDCGYGQVMSNITAWFNSCWTSWTLTNNAIIGGTHSGWTWPSNGGVSFPAAYGNVGFVNYNNGSGGNYQLLSSSPYHNAATDGKDIGVSDWTTLNTLTNFAAPASQGVPAALPSMFTENHVLSGFLALACGFCAIKNSRRIHR